MTSRADSALQDLALLNARPGWFDSAFEKPRTRSTVDVEGVSINYFKWGDPTCPGVVLLHGSMAHARYWAFIAPLLADKFCVVAPDLSGMGDSGWRTQYSAELHAMEAARVADHAGLHMPVGKPVLVCHSFSSAAGIAAVERDTDQWGGLVLCDMCLLAPGESPVFEAQLGVRQARPHRVYPTIETALDKFVLLPDQPCSNEFLVEYVAIHALKKVADGWRWKFDPAFMVSNEGRDLTWWHGVVPRFIALTTQKAIIHGDKSPMLSSAAIAYLQEVSSKSIPVVAIKDAAHHLMLDQPLALADALDRLLSQVHHAGPGPALATTWEI